MFKGVTGFEFYKDRLSAITKSANDLLFDLVEDMSHAHENARPGGYDLKEVEFQCHELNRKLVTARNEFVYLNQPLMLKVLGVGRYDPGSGS